MKKIGMKIFLFTLIPFIIILAGFVSISLSITVKEIKEISVERVQESTLTKVNSFNAFFDKLDGLNSSFKGYLEDQLSLDDLADPERLRTFESSILDFTRGVILGNNLIDMYVWFAPEYVSPELMMMEILDLDQSKTPDFNDKTQYTRSDIGNNPEWEWFWKAEEEGQTLTDPYEWEGFNGNLVSFTKAIVLDDKTVGVVGIDSFVTSLRETILNGNFMKKGYYTLLNAQGSILFNQDPEKEGKNFMEAYPAFADEYQRISGREQQTGVMESGGDIIGYSFMDTGWILLTIPNTGEIFGSINRMVVLYIILTILALGIFTLTSLLIGRSLARPITLVAETLKKISDGDLEVFNNENLIQRKDEIGALSRSMTEMINRLREIVGGVRDSSMQISQGSDQISNSSQQLASGASEQAASAEEVSSAMEEMSANISQNAENSDLTKKIALDASEKTREGSKAVTESLEAMNIIADKITIINDIASQTNLLALNAAIEAARAGDSGKGFAVVAKEIRKLAERSQLAAKEITEQSNASVKISHHSKEILESLVPKIEKTAELVKDISASSKEQEIGVEQINMAIQQLDQVIQGNAASSEELASTSEELASQARMQNQTMEYFKIKS